MINRGICSIIILYILYLSEVSDLYYCCGISDKGAVGENNEDAYLVNKIVLSKAQMESDVNAPFIAAVADGVGGKRRER